MATVENLIKAVQDAKTLGEIKSAVESCLAFTESLRGDQMHEAPGFWFPVGEALLYALSPSFIGVLSKRKYDDLFVEVFVQAPAIDSIPLLVHSLKKESGDKSKRVYVLEKALHLLDAVIRKNLAQLFIDLSSPTVIALISNADVINGLIQDLVSIPDRAAAVVRSGRMDRNSILNADSYSKLVALAMLTSLKRSRDLLSSGSGDCSLKFLSDLLGKFYLSGRGQALMRLLGPSIYGFCCGRSTSTDDFVWRRLSERLFTAVNTLALDSVVADLVIVLSSRDGRKLVDLEKVLGDSVDKDEKIRYVLTNKLLFTRHFDDKTLVPEAIVRYLSKTVDRRQSTLRPVLIKLLTLWSSPNFTTRTSFQKHHYISRGILLSVSELTDEDKRSVEAESTCLVLRGVESHLKAVDENVRKIGMVLGELLSGIFMVRQDQGKLKFDYDDDELTVNLKSVLDSRKTNNDDEFISLRDLATVANNLDDGDAPTKEPEGAMVCHVSAGLDSDDDDDLIPYDLPKELDDTSGTTATKESMPVYIKDCLDCIAERKSFHLYETGLRSLEKLIRRNSPGADDLAVEVVRILLHAEDYYGLGQEFASLQNSIMTACCVKQPKRVATYLTTEFYEKNYSVHHRLLMLDVLVSAAKELGSPCVDDGQGDMEVITVKSEEPVAPTPLTPTWRQVVQARLEKKTRRWGSTLRKAPSTSKGPVANRFTPVISYFFVPLLENIDKRVDTLDMFLADYVVLGRQLFATGTMLYEAGNAPAIIAMAISQLHLVLRRTNRHEQPFVRQGSLFALIMSILVVPSRTLVMEYQDELLEARHWLEETHSDDPDEQCRQLSVQALSLLNKKVNEGLNAVIECALPN